MVIEREERIARQQELEEARKAGIKEVVETCKRENPSAYKKYEAWWEAKLKEWGIRTMVTSEVNIVKQIICSGCGRYESECVCPKELKYKVSEAGEIHIPKAGGLTEQELRIKLINRIKNLPMIDLSETTADPKPLAIDGSLLADQLLDIVKEAGWLDPKDMIMPGEFGTPKAEELLAQAGYKSPEEIALVYNPDYLDFQKGVEATRELYKNYVRLAEDQSLPDTLPLTIRSDDPRYLDGWARDIVKRTQQDMVQVQPDGTVWRKVIL